MARFKAFVKEGFKCSETALQRGINLSKPLSEVRKPHGLLLAKRPRLKRRAATTDLKEARRTPAGDGTNAKYVQRCQQDVLESVHREATVRGPLPGLRRSDTDARDPSPDT
jgi:hypothetical protein